MKKSHPDFLTGDRSQEIKEQREDERMICRRSALLIKTQTEQRVKLLNGSLVSSVKSLPSSPEPVVSDFHVFSGRRGYKLSWRIKGLDRGCEMLDPPGEPPFEINDRVH